MNQTQEQQNDPCNLATMKSMQRKFLVLIGVVWCCLALFGPRKIVRESIPHVQGSSKFREEPFRDRERDRVHRRVCQEVRNVQRDPARHDVVGRAYSRAASRDGQGQAAMGSQTRQPADKGNAA